MLLLNAALLYSQQRLPAIEGETLAGAKVTLPAALGTATLLIIGFTRGSQEQTKAWSQRVSGRYPAWSIAVLEDVPRLIRGMVSRGIRSGTPKDQHSHFLLVYRGEQQLKQAAGFSRPDDAHLLIIDGAGTIRWRFHGAVTDAAMEQLGVVWTDEVCSTPGRGLVRAMHRARTRFRGCFG